MKTRVKTPDGTYITVNHPDNATQEEIIAYAKQNYKPNVARETSKVSDPSEPLSYSGMMKDSINNAVKSAITGGLPGLALQAGTEGLKNFDKLMQRGGYKAGGAVTDMAAPYVSPETAAGLGYATNVGVQAIPSLLGGVVGKKVLEPTMQSMGRKVMHSALKPDKAARMSGAADKAIQTLLDEGVNVTEGGVTKLEDIASSLDDRVSKIIANSGSKVDKTESLNAVVDTLGKFKKQVNPTSDIEKITKAWDEFDQVYPNQIPIQLAQDLKKGSYQMLKGKYGDLGEAGTEAQKAIVRGLKEAIEKQAPEVAGLNARNQKILNALELVANRASVAGNRDLLGIAPAAMNPKAMAAMLADRSQLVRSLLARALYSGAGPAGTAAGATAGALYSTEKNR